MTFRSIDISAMSEDEWREARRPFIGGSDAPAVNGTSQYRSPFTVATDKAGLAPPFEVNEQMELGTFFEGDILAFGVRKLKAAASAPDMCIRVEDTKDRMFVSERYEWAAVNLDGLLRFPDMGKPCVIECKFYGAHRADDFADNAIPPDAETQILHALAVYADAKGGYLFALCGNRFFTRYVARDEARIAELMEVERDFYERVMVAGEMPEPSGSFIDKRILQSQWPEATEGVTDLGDDGILWAVKYAEGGELEKRGKAMKDEAQNRLRSLLKDYRTGTAGHFKVSRSTYERKAYTVEAGSVDSIRVTEAKR